MRQLLTILLLLLLACPAIASPLAAPDSTAQLFDEPPPVIIVNGVCIEGSKRTVDQYILRELSFAQGDTFWLDDFELELTQTHNNIYNTDQFSSVDVHIQDWTGQYVNVLITVEEKFQFGFAPYLALGDPNFNVWWKDHNHALNRLIYGGTFSYNNARGRGEKLWVGAVFGFSQAGIIGYDMPSINKKQTWGATFYTKAQRNKRIPYLTTGNKQLYYEGSTYQRWELGTGMAFDYRKGLYQTHTLALNYQHIQASDTIMDLNPDYFFGGKDHLNFFEFSYRFHADHRNIRYYPTDGWELSIEFEKIGLHIFDDADIFNLFGNLSYFQPLGGNWYFSGMLGAKLSTPFNQPYSLQEGFGFEDNVVRGYEYYQLDGQQFALAKADVKYHLFDWGLNTKKIIKASPLGTIPFAAYIKLFADCGYLHDRYTFEANPLNNKFLAGGGVGLDLVVYNSLVLRAEYTLSSIGPLGGSKLQNGLYLHTTLDISSHMHFHSRMTNFKAR